MVQIFREMADLLAIKGENPFRVRAYEKAADVLEHLSGDLQDLHKEGKLEKIPGLGKGMREKISTLLNTGRLPAYDQLKKEIPAGVRELLSIPEVGPKTAKLLYEEAKVKSIEELEKCVKSHKLQHLPGMGIKTEENILRGIRLYRTSRARILLGKALPLVDEVKEELKEKASSWIERISPAGSLRRGKETIGDIDILVSSSSSHPVMEVFTNLSCVREVLAKGETKSSILTHQGLQMDLRVVSPDSFGAALQYFTGSKAHNISLRERAVRRGLKINEYGVFTQDGGKIGGRDEEEVYACLDLAFVPPELREDRGEVEAAKESRLPQLIREEEIKGDLHLHSRASDGSASIEELVEKAQEKGYQYLAITEHSVSLKVGGGLSEEDLLAQIKEIRQMNSHFEDFRVLTGSEVDIKKDGTLDYSDEVLRELDIVIAALHTGFKQDRETITTRVIKAMQNPNFRIFAHPTGRLLGERDPYAIDLDKVLEVAKEKDIWLEINAQPQRLDLTDIWIREAKERGVKMVISTDAHNIGGLDLISFGVITARRGWLESADVINTLCLKDLLKVLYKKRNSR
ncbi:DNA polymerase/3'-5' exonuclease PolX [Candidatus Aerophobetes bacterium]|uniref:DNA-directed DNA polymerase n=1 Tax=Aerophobetes bacterium TaxID=2030807 RepID=A0A523UQ75_UNCAE|nr:MAG: DNA polymerase/3'-5' exonuclease PolX [Candidatus Aerophobetes bacterium]